MTEVNQRLRRSDVVVVKDMSGFNPGRVWRRIDKDHVQVVGMGQHVIIFHDDELTKVDYKGRWLPPTRLGRPARWLPMHSLKQLKKWAGHYYPHFGGRRWTKEERQKALQERY